MLSDSDAAPSGIDSDHDASIAEAAEVHSSDSEHDSDMEVEEVPTTRATRYATY